jgi:hypothetical protein
MKRILADIAMTQPQANTERTGLAGAGEDQPQRPDEAAGNAAAIVADALPCFNTADARCRQPLRILRRR